MSCTSNRTPARPTPRISRKTRETIEGYIFIGPALLGFLAFTLFPIVATLGLSLTEYNLLSPPVWIGLDNYTAMVKDEFFWRAVRITTVFAVTAVPLGMIFAL